MKNKAFLLFALILFSSSLLVPQIGTSEKHVLVYKTVKGHDIKANIFLPSGKGPNPVLVFFHGGFFFGNRDEGLSADLKNKLLESGYAVVSADYRLAPETKLAGIMEDASDIIKWIRKDGKNSFNIDTAKIIAMGCSAGGYLAYTTGFDPVNAPDAVVAVSAPTGFSGANIPMGDLSVLKQPGPYEIVSDSIISYGDYDKRMELWRFLAKNRLAIYEIFGFDPGAEPEKLKKFTLIDNIKPGYPPTLLIHAKYDPLVDLQQVSDLHKFLSDNKIETELYIVPVGHSNDLIYQNPEVIDKVIIFLNSRLNSK